MNASHTSASNLAGESIYKSTTNKAIIVDLTDGTGETINLLQTSSK